MPIEIKCPKCQRRMRVPDTAAGKKIKCPKCHTPIPVTAAVQQETYVLKLEKGDEFGPVTKDELDEWYDDGRITEDCQILRTGSDQWQWATDLYPDLEEEEEAAPASQDAETPSGPPDIDVAQPPAETAEPPAFEADLPEDDSTAEATAATVSPSQQTPPAHQEARQPPGRWTTLILALLIANLLFTLITFITLLAK